MDLFPVNRAARMVINNELKPSKEECGKLSPKSALF
jgi:hypothetical protein